MAPLRRVKLTELNAHLVCVLCSGYFVDATTIIECLHTFCKTCIVRYLQTSSFCPICDVQVHKTKPLLSLREDRTLQDVVFKLVPELFHSEMSRRMCFYKEHPEAGGDKTEQSLRERRHFFHVDDQISLSLEYLPYAPTSTSYSLLHGLKPLKISNGQQEKIKAVEDDKEGPGGKKEDIKKEEEKEEEKMPGKVIHKRYLKCPAAVQVSHLEKFIRLKYSLTSQTHRVDIMHGGDCLVGELTLLDVVYMYKWTEDGPLRLMYTVSIIPQTRKRARPNGLRTPVATDPEAPPSKVAKTQPPLLHQQPSLHLTLSQVHPVPGRDQDAMETVHSDETVSAIDQKVVVSKIDTSVSEALAPATSSVSVTSDIGIVSSQMSINFPSLPNTILSSAIGQLPTPLPSGRRTAFTKTTAATTTPRLAVPNRSFTSTENVSTVTPVEGVAVTVQATTPVVSFTSSVGVTFTTTTTNTNSNMPPVPPLPITTVPRPSINGFVDSCGNINSMSNQPTKVLQPIIPSKPRLGRPPNSSRVSNASMKPGVRTGDNRPIRPVASGKVVNRVQGVVNRNNPTVSASLNIQSRLNSISGPKLGNAKVSIKRLSDMPKLIGSTGTNEPTEKLPSPSTSNTTTNNADSQSSVSTAALTQSQQSSNGTAISHQKPLTTCQLSDIAIDEIVPTIPNHRPVAQDVQNAASPTVQWAVAPTAQAAGGHKVQKSPIMQGQVAPRPTQQSPVGSVARTTSNTTCSPNFVSQRSEQTAWPVNNKLSQNMPRSPVPPQTAVRSPMPSQGTGCSPATSISSTLGGSPTVSVSTAQSLQHVNNKPIQVTPNRTPSNFASKGITTSAPNTISTTTACYQPHTTLAPNRMPGPAHRAPVNPAPHLAPASPAPHRALSSNAPYRPPSSPAPHRAPSSPAPHRAPPSPAPHRAPPSPAPHRAPPSPAPHRAPPSPAPHRAPPSPAPHKAPPSPAPHKAPPSPAPHRAPPSPAPHRAPPSPAPHRAPPSPAPHRAPPSPAPHRAPPSPAPHRAPPSPAPHRAPPSTAPHRAPPSPAPHRAPPSPAPHRAPQSPASLQAPPSPASLQAPQSPASLQAPPSPATHLAPASPATYPAPASPVTSCQSLQQAQSKPSLVTSKANSQITYQSKSSQSFKTTAHSQSTGAIGAKTLVTSGSMSHISSKDLAVMANNVALANRVTSSNAGNKYIPKSTTTTALSTNSMPNSTLASTKVSPGVKAPPKSPGRKKGGSGSSPTILSIAQNLANRQLQQRTVNSTLHPSTVTTNSIHTTQVGAQQPYVPTTQVGAQPPYIPTTQVGVQPYIPTTQVGVQPPYIPTTQVGAQQPFTTTSNAAVYPGQVGGGLVSPALAAAYMASAYGGDASALADVTAMRNLITLSQTAACIRELNLAAMVKAAEALPRPSDPAPIDLSPTSKAAPQSPLTNGRGHTVYTTSPITTNSKPTQSPKYGQTKTSVSSAGSAPTISPPTPEVTITKLPSTPSASAVTNPTITTSGKNVPGLVKIASSSTNTVSITKRPVSVNRIAVAKSPANASIRQIPNPSFLRHQSEVRNNNNLSKSSPLSSSGNRSNATTTTTTTTKIQQSPKLTSNSRTTTGNSPLKDTGPMPETSSILKIENLTRSLAPAAATAPSASSPSFRFFDNR